MKLKLSTSPQQRQRRSGSSHNLVYTLIHKHHGNLNKYYHLLQRLRLRSSSCITVHISSSTRQLNQQHGNPTSACEGTHSLANIISTQLLKAKHNSGDTSAVITLEKIDVFDFSSVRNAITTSRKSHLEEKLVSAWLAPLN